jgi:hypothetical protein
MEGWSSRKQLRSEMRPSTVRLGSRLSAKASKAMCSAGVKVKALSLAKCRKAAGLTNTAEKQVQKRILRARPPESVLEWADRAKILEVTIVRVCGLGRFVLPCASMLDMFAVVGNGTM